MDRFGRPTLTRPATPQAFKVAAGRYSFVPPKGEEGTEVIEIPEHLREDHVNVKGNRT